MGHRRGGIIFVKVNGMQYDAKGEFTYDLGVSKKEAVVGQEGVHGFKETPKVAFIEGTITDSSTLDMKALRGTVDATVTLQLANGKTVLLREAWEASDGNVKTGEGEANFRFEGKSADEF